MSYYQRNRVYQSSVGKSTFMPDIMPKVATLRNDLLTYLGRKQPGINHTAFKEIGIVPPNRVWSTSTKSLLANMPVPQQVNRDRFADIMLNAMKKAIAEKWNPAKFHVIQHSSGFDSRLISTALVALRKEKGKDWIGDILFVEGAGEQDSFRQIMKVQGWAQDQYAVYNPVRIPRKKHERSFIFKDAWRKLNGYCSYPVNINIDLFEWLNERGQIPNSQQCQVVTGYGANEIGNWVKHRGGFKPYLNFIYYHALSHFPLWGGESVWIHPFYHLGYIKTWMKYHKGQPAEYRKTILHRVAPKLTKIPRTSKQHKFKVGYRAITKSQLERCVRDYKASWFAKNVHPEITPKTTINYLPVWWGYWSLASFCEYLIENGHTIKVEG